VLRDCVYELRRARERPLAENLLDAACYARG